MFLLQNGGTWWNCAKPSSSNSHSPLLGPPLERHPCPNRQAGLAGLALLLSFVFSSRSARRTHMTQAQRLRIGLPPPWPKPIRPRETSREFPPCAPGGAQRTPTFALFALLSFPWICCGQEAGEQETSKHRCPSFGDLLPDTPKSKDGFCHHPSKGSAFSFLAKTR